MKFQIIRKILGVWEHYNKGGCNAPKIPYNFYNNFIIYSGYELSQTWVFPEILIN